MSQNLYHLAEGKDNLEKILDFLPYPFLIAAIGNSTYQNLYLNQKFSAEIGYTLEEIPTIDAWFRHAYPDENYRKEVINGWNQRSETARQSGKDSVMMRVLLQTKHQGKKWYEVKSSFIGQWQLVAFINIHDQLTQQVELQRLNDNKNQVLSVLSHDLRAPIQGLQAVMELAMDKKVSQAEFDELIGSIYEKSRGILDLLDTTLLWAKSNFNSIQLRNQPVHIHAVVNPIVQAYKGICETKNISILVSILDESPTTDADVVSIILRNLLSNALKFTRVGGRVEISSQRMPGFYVLEVYDNGIGMTPETIRKIMMQAASSSLGTRSEKGHGIGLQLCHHLAKQIGGKLEFESESGKGTSVRLFLPYA